MANPENPVQFVTLENGDLKIVISKDYRTALEDMIEWFDDMVKFYLHGCIMEKMIEKYSEYEYEYFESNEDLLRRENISMGLTSASVLVQRAPGDETERGEIDEWSKFWVYDMYAIRSEIDDLIHKGEVTFTFVSAYEELLDAEEEVLSGEEE